MPHAGWLLYDHKHSNGTPSLEFKDCKNPTCIRRQKLLAQKDEIK